jgi:hypothetical protein
MIKVAQADISISLITGKSRYLRRAFKDEISLRFPSSIMG